MPSGMCGTTIRKFGASSACRTCKYAASRGPISAGSSQKMTVIWRAKRLIKCCGRWNTKFQRKCEKQINVTGCGSGAEGSATVSTGTQTRVSIFRLTSVLYLRFGPHQDERAE